jgi:molybdate transport system substrate-binding protein
MILKLKKAFAIITGVLLFCNTCVIAAELKMIGNPGMSEIMTSIVPEFERNTGHRIRWNLGLFSKLKPVIDQGDFDVIVTTGEVAEYVVNQKAVIGDLVTVAQVGIGVAIKKGASKSDISSVEAFKNTLLSAKSISYTSGSTAGKYLENLMQRLGIAEQMKPKTKLLGGGGQNPRAVAAGEVELGLSLISDIAPIQGVELLGPLPPEVQFLIAERAGVSAVTKEIEAASAFVKFLRSPLAQKAFRAQGLEPVN